MLNIAVCDDEQMICNDIYTRLHKINPAFLVDVFNSGEKLLQTDLKYDIIFLDIEMSGINGMDVAERIMQKNKNIYIIFLTSHTEFMQSAFKVRAFRFLAKPICETDFIESVSQAEKELLRFEKLFITSNYETNIVNKEKIVYIEAFGDGSFVYTTDKVYESNKSLKYWENELDNEHFFRVHKSFFIALRYIENTHDNWLNMQYYNEAIPISRRNMKEFKKCFFDYIKNYARYI